MNKIKTVSLLLVASMCLSLTGCSGRKKVIIETADSYAQALISGDPGEVADLLDDGDEFEEAFGSYLESYAKDEDLEDIFDFILENTTYELDKSSANVSAKEATIEITFTMPDYICVYEDLDDDAEADDFLDALKDAPDETITFTQKIEIKLVTDEWKIADEDFKNTFEFYKFYQEISDLGFDRLLPYTCDELEEILINEFGAEPDDFNRFDTDSYDSFDYHGDGFYLEVTVYHDVDTAASRFEDEYERFVNVTAEDFNGDYSYDFDGESGYIVYDGSVYSEFMYGEFYGGEFYADGTRIMLTAGSDEGKDNADAFLQALGYPTP